ncbi:SAM-dependent methyltransferase [Brachybacterium sp. Marseille-Q2903]|uniref:SAM-dependent methyltransferase n=1 Tax=Brachybacterium epidermidis TaxID=2781983 RepID=A0ABR9W3E1_9MICO|nr:SAM-dependent methyltransferase [Brachybacterium epidermidis]MBE9404964.1 SAM-dependent methyltransferase [Brachybacterium epidermidis]
MATDFAGAHDRHLSDAEHLENSARLSNADHLYGFAAECGLKALMTKFGMPVDPAGDPLRPNRVHIDSLWTRYSVYASGPSASAYQLDATNHFDDWRAADRYAEDGHVTATSLERHRNGAAQVDALVRQARVEGLLP